MGVGAADPGGASSPWTLACSVHPRYPKIAETPRARCTQLDLYPASGTQTRPKMGWIFARCGMKSSSSSLAPGPRGPMQNSSLVLVCLAARTRGDNDHVGHPPSWRNFPTSRCLSERQ